MTATAPRDRSPTRPRRRAPAWRRLTRRAPEVADPTAARRPFTGRAEAARAPEAGRAPEGGALPAARLLRLRVAAGRRAAVRGDGVAAGRRWARVAVAVGTGLVGGLGAGWLHLRLGTAPAGLFVAGLPWPLPVALDTTVALWAGGGYGLVDLACLLALRVGWSALVVLLAVPDGAQARVGWMAAAAAVPLVGGLPVAAGGLAGGPAASAAALAVVMASWSLAAAFASGRRPKIRTLVAAAVAQAAALLLTPSGAAGARSPLIDAAMAGIEGTLVLLLVLRTARGPRGRPR